MNLSTERFNVLSLKNTLELQKYRISENQNKELDVPASISNVMVFQSLQKSATCNFKHLRPSSALFWYIKGCSSYHEQYLNHVFNKPWEFYSIMLVLS